MPTSTALAETVVTEKARRIVTEGTVAVMTHAAEKETTVTRAQENANLADKICNQLWLFQSARNEAENGGNLDCHLVSSLPQ
mmetsp:Transcript_27616/g.54293  ORF Transcript_27616/g.54293 Transcript_27616/m.54293 type:complete len:82 (+) Transcript_27616:367-612(+)